MVRGEEIKRDADTLHQVDWRKLEETKDVRDGSAGRTMGYRKGDEVRPTPTKGSLAERMRERSQRRAAGALNMTSSEARRVSLYDKLVNDALQREGHDSSRTRRARQAAFEARWQKDVDELSRGGFLSRDARRQALKQLLEEGVIDGDEFVALERGDGIYTTQDADTMWDKTVANLAERGVLGDEDGGEDGTEKGKDEGIVEAEPEPEEDPFPYKKPTTLPR